MREVDSINLNLAQSVLCLKNPPVTTQEVTELSLKFHTTDPTTPPLSRMAVRNPAACNLSNPNIMKVNLTPTSSQQLKA
jgi:hypothetical protein